MAEQQNEKDPPIDKIFTIIKEGFKEKVGQELEITTKEIEKVSKKEPRIITKIDKNKFRFHKYI